MTQPARTVRLAVRRTYRPDPVEQVQLTEVRVETMLVGRMTLRRGDRIANPLRKGAQGLVFVALVLGPNGQPKHVLARQRNGIDRYLRPEVVRRIG